MEMGRNARNKPAAAYAANRYSISSYQLSSRADRSLLWPLTQEGFVFLCILIENSNKMQNRRVNCANMILNCTKYEIEAVFSDIMHISKISHILEKFKVFVHIHFFSETILHIKFRHFAL